MIEFPFEVVRAPRGRLLRPKAVVRSFGPSRSLTVDFLIDSGADATVVTWQVGQYLGWAVAPSENPYPLGGISGSLPCYRRRVDMDIGGIRFPGTVMWALSDDLPNLLGREDVFDHFDIEFRQRERRIRFHPNRP